jgi:hypothetical protein
LAAGEEPSKDEQPSEVEVPGEDVIPSEIEALSPVEAPEPLLLARELLYEHSLDESALHYEQLVQSPETAKELVGELEQAVRDHPKHSALQRVLGDAYVRTGQLQDALDAYRQALSKL